MWSDGTRYKFHEAANWEALVACVGFLAIADAYALRHPRECEAYLKRYYVGGGYGMDRSEGFVAPEVADWRVSNLKVLRQWARSRLGRSILEEFHFEKFWIAAMDKRQSRPELARERADALHSLALRHGQECWTKR